MSYRVFNNEEVREVDWIELNQLRKDILWIFAQNVGELNASFVPSYSFTSNYWEYLTLDDRGLDPDDLSFYINGALIIVLCMAVEYIDIEGGDQNIFGKSGLNKVTKYVDQFTPKDTNQRKLREIVLLGLFIAKELEKDIQLNSKANDHPDLENFYAQLNWVDDTYIRSYFKKLVE